MPGLTISNRPIPGELLKVLPGYVSREHIAQDDLFICSSGYKAYSIREWQTGDWHILLEGHIYDLSDEAIVEQLNALVERGIDNHEWHKWISARDGDFIILAIHAESGQFMIVNDRFGRLPFYLYVKDSDFIFSREISLILDFGNPSPDPLLTACYLSFGYVCGDRTLYKEVRKMAPFSVLHYRKDSGLTEVNYFCSKEMFIGESIADSGVLKDKLSFALQRRIMKCGPAGLALSGGLDSRLLAALLEESGTRIPAFTYTRDPQQNDVDLISANEIAEHLQMGLRHTIIDLSQSCDGLEELWTIKRGQNFLAMGYIIPFLKLYGEKELTQITGDGGDKTLENTYPLRTLNSEDDLLRYIFKKHRVLPSSSVEKITGVAEHELRSYVLSTLEKDPELSFDQKYAVFILKERAMNWLFEGEDRNRYYAWTCTPFYAPDAFMVAFRIDPKQKEYGKLFSDLLSQLPGETQHILNPNWGLPPVPHEPVRKLFRRQHWKTRIPDFLLRSLSKKSKMSWKDFTLGNQLHDPVANGQFPEWLNCNKITEGTRFTQNEHWTFYTVLRMLSRGKE